MRKIIIMSILWFCWFYPAQPVNADGFIVIQPDPQMIAPFQLEVKYHNVDVKINDLTATTNIDQVFYNPGSRRLEGNYLFPVPKGAAIKKFSMDINGVETTAEFLDAAKARKIYEDIVRKQLDPALLEYTDRDLFRVRIFPIEPRSEKRIKISYTEVLNKDNGTVEYMYPLNTEKFSTKELKELNIKVDLSTASELKNIYCTTHEVEIVKKNPKTALISYEAQNTKPDTDFKLYFTSTDSLLGLSMISYKDVGDDGFFLMDISPGIHVAENEVSDKDVIFILDSSGSMAGDKLDRAKKALTYCIENLNKSDRFQLIRFSTDTDTLFNTITRVSPESISQANEFIKNIKPLGGTNIDEALTLGLSNANDKNRTALIIFITDGKPTIGETEENPLLKKIKAANALNIRIFTFGIGFEINTHLLDKITETTKGYSSYITPSENITDKITGFFNKIKSPVLTDVKLSFSNNIKIYHSYPKDLSDMFAGSSLKILGRYSGGGKCIVTLEGMIKQKKEKFTFEIVFPETNTRDEFIPALWATRRIGYLLDQIRLNGEDKELTDEIVVLARKYGIITPYTSYLIMEDEVIRTNRNEIDKKSQLLNNIIKKDEILQSNRNDYQKMKEEKSGEKSVLASRSLQDLSKTYNYNQVREQPLVQDNNSSMEDSSQISQKIRNINSKAFYQVNDYWIDPDTVGKKNLELVKIKFASDKYFELLKNNPEIRKYLSIGKNIRILLKNKIYEISE